MAGDVNTGKVLVALPMAAWSVIADRIGGWEGWDADITTQTQSTTETDDVIAALRFVVDDGGDRVHPEFSARCGSLLEVFSE